MTQKKTDTTKKTRERVSSLTPKQLEKIESTLSENDRYSLALVAGHEFAITADLLDCDSDIVKKLVSKGAKIEYAKRILPEFRFKKDYTRRDLIYMSIPHSVKKPKVPHLSFGYVIYAQVSNGDPERRIEFVKQREKGREDTIRRRNSYTRYRVVINFAAIDSHTKRYMLFGKEFELGVSLDENYEIDKEELKQTMKTVDEKLDELDRFIFSLENDNPQKERLQALNRELLGAMLRTGRRTSEVSNFEDYQNLETLMIDEELTPETFTAPWAKTMTKFSLWRIAFNNVFNINLVNSLKIQCEVEGKIAVLANKHKGVESLTSTQEIPIIEIISRALEVTQVTQENYEDAAIPVKFDIKKFV